MSRVDFFGSNVPKSELVGLQMYRKTAEAVICDLLPDSPSATFSRTQGKFHF